MTAYILDPTFSSGSGFFLDGESWPDYGVNTFAIRPNGRVLVAGIFDFYRGESANYIVQLFGDGSRDTTFSVGTGFGYTPYPGSIPFTANVYALELQANGQVLVGGRFESYDGTPAVHLVRLNTDGSLDETFAPQFDLMLYTGSGSTLGQVWSVVTQPDGKILVAGVGLVYDGGPATPLLRLNSDGSLDATFDTSFIESYYVNTIALQSDGKILCGVDTVYPLLRLNSDGTHDTTFGTALTLDSSWPGAVYQVLVQPDGKVLAGGEFHLADDGGVLPLVRFNGDGTLDETFTPPTDPGFPYINSIELDSLGRILATVSNGSFYSLMRYNPDGSVDSDFDIGTGFSDGWYGIIVPVKALAGDRILVGGKFEMFNGSPANRLARIMPTPPPVPSTTYVTFSGSDVTVYGDGDTAYTLVDDGLVMPGKVARIRYAADSDFTHGSVALASQWQQSFLTLRVRVEGVSETDLAAKLADLETAIGQFSYTVTVNRDAQVTVWQADQGSMQLERSRRFYADEFAETWTITIPVYPIYS